jgi:hypothetical protein
VPGRCWWIDEQQGLSGIFTVRLPKDAAVTTLAQAMTPDPITISPDSRAIDTTILARY